MPTTRSQTQQSSESFIVTTGDDAGATSHTYPSTATIEANTTHTEGTMDVSKPHTDGKPAAHTAKSVRSSRPSSTSSRRKKLTKAREELVKRQIELAAIRVAALEEESDEESSYDEATVRDDRTSAWIRESTLTPHIEKATQTDKDKPTCEVVDIPVQRANKEKNTCVSETQPARIEAPPVYNTAFNYNELANAITFAARCTQPLTRVHELPLFSGASSDWLPFKVAYEESASACSEQENLGRLRRSLKGAAKEAVQCLFVGNTTTAEVIKLLTSRFGRPDALVTAEINKLRALPRLNDNPRDTCLFASRIFNVTATIKALNKRHYLYNAEVVREVIDKLPATLRHRYYDFIAEQPEEQPDLITLSKFFERIAERCGNFAPAELVASEDRREHRKIVRSFHNVEKSPMNIKTCPICKKGNHRSNDCKTFRDAEVPMRWDIAKQYKLCFRCLGIRKFRHSCKTRRCERDGCHYSHHPLLHRNKEPSEKEDNAPAAGIVTSARDNRHSCAFLKILPVELTGPKGSCHTYALLDDGSTCTLIDAKMAAKIGANGPSAPFYIEGVAGSKINATEAQRVRVKICGNNTPSYDISARTMEDLHLSPQTVSRKIVRACQHLKDIETQLTYEGGKPTLLLGQDNWPLLIAHETRRGMNSEPAASLTDLGWVIHGTRYVTSRYRPRINHVTVPEDSEARIENMMREHFALESLGVEPRRSHNPEEQRALDILHEKTHRLPAGGFETGLLWRINNITPPDSYENAVRRLELVEKKLDRNEQLKCKYKAQLQALLDKGYAEPAPASKTNKVWYLPHFAVINPQKPNKIRIVHDAAAKTRGISLNDMLLSGPDLLQSLPGVLMRFRQHSIAVTADIQDMFIRVKIIEEDRDMQRFLWRDDRRQGAPLEYRMKSVIFGATSSPCTAIYIKNKNAADFEMTHPEATTAIVKNHYVDDYLCSFDTVDKAIEISEQVAYIHQRGNFHLQRWASNSNEVRTKFMTGDKKNVVHLNREKILGMVWLTETDTLTFNMNLSKVPLDIWNGNRTPTKREALRTVMSIYDPLGVATPVTIQAKRIMQDTWRSGISWDTKLETAHATAWVKWIAQARLLQHISIPRCYPGLTRARDAQIHTFVDASSSAYAAAVYWRTTDRDGNIQVSLIAGKGRVAPLKTVSIPRLELQGAVLGCRLARTATEEHDVKPSKQVYWTDSRTVLSWLRTGPRAYKPFVAHRIAEIAEVTKTTDWRWVPSSQNVADDATRETPSDFADTHRWYRGPDFLYRAEEEWPTEDSAASQTHGKEEERVHLIRSVTRLTEGLPDVSLFSNWMRLIRTTARVLQFIAIVRAKKITCAIVRKRNKAIHEKDPAWNVKHKTNRNKGITFTRATTRENIVKIDATYLHRAKTLWVRAQQEEVFPEDLAALRRGSALSTNSRLIQYAVIIDDEGVVRLKSRVAAAIDITDSQREPPILDGNHPWTRLFILWVHANLHHSGFEATTNEVRQQYWILKLRNAVRTQLKRCQTCRIRRAKPALPSTGNHPRNRVAHHQRAFTYTGLDYFGPMQVTVGRSQQKRYVALFTCLTTRAIHLEIAGSLNTDSAIMALRRFIARRGCPTELWSDQGTNLRGADQELQRAAHEVTEEEASRRLIKWRYIPPSAPFMGGVWERLVRSVKTALHFTLRERAPKEEVLATLLAEAEHTINSRPLTHVSTAAEDEPALTPNHFLLGGPSRVPLPGVFTEQDTAGRKEWRFSQQLADKFWGRWVREYLPELQHRREPRARGNIAIGDFVLIADGTLPRDSWPRGVVVTTYPGPDGEVRAVDVRTTKGTLRRPTKKLAILRVGSSTDDNRER